MIAIPSLPSEQLTEMKEQFDALLRSTERDGIEELLAYLETTDFYTAPASTGNHGAIIGGLLCHSLQVYKYLKNFLKPFSDQISDDSMVICALLHDLCKANFYKKQIRNVKIPGEKRWEEQESFGIEDQLPLGHGEKSMYIVMRFISLSEDEAMAIRWHMGGFDDAGRSYISGRALANAYDRCKLAVALNIADMYVANLVGM